MTRYEDLPYRTCVGVMLLNTKGLVFIGRRAGGVEHVEVPLNAVAARSSAGVPTSGRKPWSRPRQPSVS